MMHFQTVRSVSYLSPLPLLTDLTDATRIYAYTP
jgi:hypothetical protein